MADTSERFVDTLDQWRLALGLGHNAFARHLGISHAYWHQLRTSRREPSNALISSVLAKAPEPWKSALEKAHLADLAVPA